MNLPVGISCRVIHEGVSVDIPEPRDAFAVLEAVERRLGITAKDVDEALDAMMKHREEK